MSRAKTTTAKWEAVHLIKVEVSKFKSITESSAFAVDEKVTALVGKNESGKTAVLQAMYRIKPLPSGHPTNFDGLRDYPRRFFARHKATVNDIYPIRMWFTPDPADRESLEQAFGEGALIAEQIEVSRRYGDEDTSWTGPLADERVVLRHRVAKSGLDPDRYVKADVPSTIAALAEDTDAPAAVALSSELATFEPEAAVRAHLAGLLPRFQYFDEYNVLPGSVSIHRLQTVHEDQLEGRERTALSLLRLADVESKAFTEADYEPRKAALEAAANQLTDELFEFWTQNKDLAVELDIEFRPVPGQPAPEPWLQIRVKNNRHRVTLNMAERSKGFIWFFSFLAAFSEYADEGRRIVLLDEPGLSLHAMAQGDLLRFIDERVAIYHQILYSTHSLFMIDPQRLERCRTVEDVDADAGKVGSGGTRVSEDIWAARPDTVFPLLGALGVDMTQTLIIGPNQLLVEGPADLIYLTVMSDVVRTNGGTGLDPRWTLTPAGGLDKIPTFIALLGGSDLHVVVLMDVAAGGNQKITGLVQRGMLDQRNLVPLTEITGTTEADIEDMFAPEWYLKLLTASGIGEVAKNRLAGGRIVKQVEAALGSRYDHYRPASHLLRSPGSLLDEIDGATKDRFAALFARLNALLV